MKIPAFRAAVCVAVILQCALPGLLSTRRAAAETRGRVASFSSASHGVRLSLSLPDRSYPRGALVRVTVRAKNVSGQTVYLWTPSDGEGNGVALLQPEALSRTGRVLFPPAIHFAPAGMIPPPLRVPIAPGQVRQEVAYVVLRGPRLRASADIAESEQFPGYTLRTPPLALHLTRSEPPAV